jgi:radical SAM superfamily enzyme YgiQ (UPF0313 family)
MSKPSLSYIILAAVHLEPGPEAIPLGAACIASALKVAFPDIPVSLAEALVSEGAAGLIRKIKAYVADSAVPELKTGVAAIGFSLYSWNRAIMTEAAALLRAQWPGLFLFCGGPEATALPLGLACFQGGPFDAVIPGEAEIGAGRVLRERFFSGIEPVAPYQEAVAEIPWPSPWLDRTLKPNTCQGILWELARGCPYNCAYCYESGKRQVRYVPQERIHQELRLFIQNRVPYVFVLDPTFNSDNQRALRVLDMIAKETLTRGKPTPAIQWHFEVRGELLNRDQVRRFARLGASLQIGLQTANPKTAALIGRSLNPGLFSSRIQLLNDAGVIFGLDLIYGLPGDTLAGYRKSLDFALALYPNNLDMFRLSVLPGTVLWERAREFGLKAQAEAPYELISTPDFPVSDMARAEQLSAAADIFYNQGRAVAWFNQVLYPLRMKPAVFLEGFAAFLKVNSPEDIEQVQLAYLKQAYTRAKKQHLLSAVSDIVRFHGAWGRALAEGLSTDITFHYHPDAVLGEGAMDIQEFAASCRQTPMTGLVRPGREGPELFTEIT